MLFFRQNCFMDFFVCFQLEHESYLVHKSDLMQDENATHFIKHYSTLDKQYNNPNEVYIEAFEKLKTNIRSKGFTDQKYRFHKYCEINPDLLPSPFLSCHANADSITRFRLGSHKLPIETGRWTRTPRADGLCPKCNLIGDEYHVLFYCCEIYRNP